MREPAADLTFKVISHGSADYEAALVLRDAVLRRPLGLSVYDQDLAAERSQWHFGLWSARGNSERAQGLLACVSAVPLDERRVKLRQMAVAPEQQGRGVGARLVLIVEAWLRDRGTAEVTLHARKTAAGFYAKLGYREAGAEFIEVGIPHTKMTKSLARSVPDDR